MDLQSFIKHNASTILTSLGAAGVLATAIITANETPKALSLLEEAKEKKGEKLTKWEKVKIAGPTYIPAIATGAATVACIFGSNMISKRKQTTLMSAYALLDNSYKEYKKKVNELYGEEAGERVREKIAKDKYAGDGSLSDDSKELFFDFYSGRYFESTKEAVVLAQYEANRALIVNGAVCLNEYYDFLGLETKSEYELVGWSCRQIEEMYGHPWIEFDYEKTVIDEESEYSEGLACTIIHIPLEPLMNYLEY